MKKLKKILPAVLAAAMAAALVFSVACNGGCSSCKKEEEPKGDVTYSLQSIDLDTSAVKTEYLVGESFTSDGLIIIANLAGSDGSLKTENLTPSTDGVRVRDNNFNKDVAGEYKIDVNYIYLNVSRSSSYNVKVNARKAGLQVQLKESQTDTVTLSETMKRADLTGFAEWIEVREPNEWGIVPDNAPLVSADKLTIELYKNKTKVTDVTSLSGGDYQIYASMPYAEDSSFTLEGFVTIYVVDKIENLALDTTASGLLLVQEQNVRDTMTPTWKFVASYVSGDKENLSISDVSVSGVNTVSPTTSGTRNATVSYKYTDCKGAATTVRCSVPYSITSAGYTDHANTFSRSALETALRTRLGLASGAGITDKTPLEIKDFTGVNSFIKLLFEDSANQYRDKNDCFEIKGDALEIEIKGMATIDVSFASTGGSNVSRLALRDKDLTYNDEDDETGHYEYYEATTTATAVYDESGVAIAYETTGTGYVTVTFIIAKAGNYVICSPYGKTTRGCRITSIVVRDYY